VLGAKVADLATELDIQRIIEEQVKKRHVSLMTTTTMAIRLPTVLMKTVIVMPSLRFFWKRRRII
jgi:hypothetical protein